MKPCTRCVHVEKRQTAYGHFNGYACTRDSKVDVDLVTGRKVVTNTYPCEEQRGYSFESHCGEEGKFFKSKWWYFWG
jgi:hypothetical protein